MRNQDRLSPPYVLGTMDSGQISAAGLAIAAAGSTTLSGPVVAIRTNGGAVIALPAPYASVSTPDPPQSQSSGSSS